MDCNLDQWGNTTEEQQEIETPPSAKLGLHSHTNSPASSVLPLFVPQHHSSLSSQNSTALSATISKSVSLPLEQNAHKHPAVVGMGSYFSLSQWQELELQTLIFRHMLAGAAVPPELLHLVKKSFITDPPPSHYLCNPLHQYYPQYHSPLVQSGYWGRSAMDPEPGRCRRTDGKKWRCSRDVVAGQKYCERHVHRGRNRSRKHVEVPTSTFFDNGGGGGEALKRNNSTQEMSTGGGGTSRFSLSGPSSPSMDLLQLNRRPLDSMIETKCPFEAPNDSQGGDRTLRRFFDDWPRSVHETNDATSLSISMPSNSSSSDFSLKLGTGNGDELRAQAASSERERPQLNWGMAWDANTASPLGGPLAEALRSSSASNSSPTSVLYRLTRSSISEVTNVSS